MKFRLYICFIFLLACANISFASKCSSFQELRFADGSTGCMSDYKFFTIKRPPFAPDGLAELIYGKQSFSIAVNKNPNTCPIPWSAYHWGGPMRNTSSAALQECESKIIEGALNRYLNPKTCECEIIYEASPSQVNVPVSRGELETKTRAWAALTQYDSRFKPQYSQEELEANKKFYAQYVGGGSLQNIENNKQQIALEKPKPQVTPLPSISGQAQQPIDEKNIQALKDKDTKINPIVEASPVLAPIKTSSVMNADNLSRQTTKSVRALIIGNSNYGVSALINPTNDAQAIARRLAEFGFKVDLVLDGNRKSLISALTKYQTESSKYDINILYYAGHGIQLNGINYIVPVDMSLAPNGANVEFDAIPVNSIVEKYMQANTKLVFLDACRDNPLSRSLQVASRSSGGSSRGLAAMEVGGGTLISYSTKDGSVALDGDGKNSPYTEAMLAHMNERIDISLLLRKVRKTVMAKTNGKQVPWDYGSLMTDELVLSNK